MVIVGFNFTKISAERKNPVKGNVKISNNVGITKIEKQNLSLGKAKQNGLRFEFEFTTKYEKDFGEIVLRGEVAYMADEKQVDEIVEKWDKSKAIPKDVLSDVLNNVLNKCNIQALLMSQQINFPAPIKLPSVNVVDKKQA